jgi:hypothetical protein
MNNNLIELAKLIFEGEPKDPNSIQMQYEDYNSIEDIFEVLLHIFIYGFKIKKLNLDTIHTLIPYFRSICVNLKVEKIEYSELVFLTDPRYKERYCNISSRCFDNYDLDKLGFGLSRNYKSVNEIDDIRACFVYEIKNNFIDSFIAFISFNFKF